MWFKNISLERECKILDGKTVRLVKLAAEVQVCSLTLRLLTTMTPGLESQLQSVYMKPLNSTLCGQFT